jgi:ATP adenylyltransferase
MDVLFSPWRSVYIQSFSETVKPKTDDCFLCNAAQSDSDDEHLVVYRGNSVFVILNRYPYNSGHVMIVPLKHGGDISTIESNVLTEMMATIQLATRVLQSVYNPHGFNIGANLGKVAGAGVPDHLHFHIVPRWNGDVNFMPVLSDIKVASESLDDTYNKIKQGFATTTQHGV